MANVLTIQIRPVIGEREKNLEKVKQIIENNADKKPDLIIMPEFFNTGISKPAFERLAEEEADSPTKAFFCELAKKYNSYILCGSIVEKEGDKLFNTSYLLDRKGNIIGKYRKKNLFKFFGGTEDQYITPGEEFVVVETELGKIGMSTCFDISYPMHFAELIQRGAEIIVCPAAWCAPSEDEIQKDALRKWWCWNGARAADNSVYFVSADLCGKIDSFLSCVGHSCITDFDGKLLACAGAQEGAAFAQIDVKKLQEYRKIAPVKF